MLYMYGMLEEAQGGTNVVDVFKPI